MKNLGSILAVLATTFTIISARAVPADQSLDARTALPFLHETADIEVRTPKKTAKAKAAAATKAKGGKGKKAAAAAAAVRKL